MTPLDISVVVVSAGEGTRAFVRTVDCLQRQRVRPRRLLLACRAEGTTDVLRSTASRAGATLTDGATIPAALNAAVIDADAGGILVVPGGYRPGPDCLDVCSRRLAECPGIDVLVPAIRVESADGLRFRLREPTDLSLPALLAEPGLMPPVICFRRAAWSRLRGLDESAGVLALYDLVLRMLETGSTVATAETIAACDVTQRDEWPPRDIDRTAYLDLLRGVYSKHQPALEAVMTEVLVRRQILFGTLRDEHRGQVARRDAGLAELDRLRAETAHLRAWLSHHGIDALDWGDLRRSNPVSRNWGYDRGTPIDRHYIHEFLASHSSDVKGTVLEIQEDDLTREHGGPRVTGVDVADLDEANPRANLTADLRWAPHLPASRYDCIVLTQTLHVIDDLTAVLRECHRLLRPGGVLLATLPGASRVCLEYGEEGDLWRVTPAGARRLFESVFGTEVETTAYGNVLTNVAFLEGLACAELADSEFDRVDPYYPAVVGVSARKREPGPMKRRPRGVVLLYHRLDGREDVHGLAVDPAAFASHLAWLNSECTVLPLDTLLSTPLDRLPERAVALTFDDGYLDCLERAAPQLDSLGLPATFFLTTRWLDEPGEYWWDTLERVLLTSGPLPAAFRCELDGGEVTHQLAEPAERRAAHDDLHRRLVHASLETRDRVIAGLKQWSGSPTATRCRPLLADEVRALSQYPGVTIGAHSVNHLALPDQSASSAAAEVDGSRAALERVLGRRVCDFAYPYGALDRASTAAVRQAWRWGCACDNGAVGDPFDAARVPRLDVKNWRANVLASRLDELFMPRGSNFQRPTPNLRSPDL